MRLRRIGVRGFRRFARSHELQITGKLTAIVGPNEVGKTSLLKALDYLGNDTAIADADLTRWAPPPDGEPVVWAVFEIEVDDRTQLLDDVPEAHAARMLQLLKYRDGSRQWHVEEPIDRSTRLRESAKSALQRAAAVRKLADWVIPSEPPPEGEEPEEASDPQPLGPLLLAVADGLSVGGDSDLSAEFRERLRNLVGLVRTGVDETSARTAEALAGLLSDLHDYESSSHPRDRAEALLRRRTPEFAFFDSASQDLRSDYTVDEIRASPPGSPIRNLAGYSGLDLDHLANALDSQADALAVSLATAATDVLRESLKSWTQLELECELTAETTSRMLRVHVGTRGSLWRIEDRSAGLQWFVALVAFLHARGRNNPVLLVDEAETHLHYDAQADLIQTMVSQPVTANVIYSTHSAGCLPDDLSSVRIVEAENDNESTLSNWFWLSHRPGISPLIMQMGATNFAFLHARRAVMTEGASDFLLMPAILKSATERTALPFQVAPGLSEANSDDWRRLDSEAGAVVYVVDNDDGGKALAQRLRGIGIPPGRIFKLPGTARTIEDFVDPDLLAEALTHLIGLSGASITLPKSVLPARDRWKAIVTWCDANGVAVPDKRPLAHAILERSTEVVSNARRPSVVAFLAKLEAALGIEP